ncbi:hypothetical protein GCM10011579_015720 [Streptomyces albiflavescens]|uniref:Uncharacterized protein n=1 Tax=Streptomyces albiflavescens TaxID=1623582 RepID=A0A917XWR9_9ACTN|nr:hypothetical protein GCM10011579_015720 [Streptomyces albiflavescens]
MQASTRRCPATSQGPADPVLQSPHIGKARPRSGVGSHIPVRRRRCVPQLPALSDPFGEERLRAQPEGVGRCLVASGPAAWAAAMAAAAVGDGAATRAAGGCGCA